MTGKPAESQSFFYFDVYSYELQFNEPVRRPSQFIERKSFIKQKPNTPEQLSNRGSKGKGAQAKPQNKRW